MQFNRNNTNMNNLLNGENDTNSISAAQISHGKKIVKKATAAMMASLLAAWITTPALALEDAADSTSFDTALSDLGNCALQSDATTSTQNAAQDQSLLQQPSAQDMLVQTVPLSPKGQEVSEESIAHAATSEQSEEDAKDAVEDIETCKWSFDGQSWSTMRNGSEMKISNAIAFGVDVSEWQGNIDWASAKADGVQYAILRVAYGSQTSGHEDYYFAKNVAGCLENNIPFGVYLYSNSSTTEDGIKEARFAIEIMQRSGATPENVVFPVYYDLEDDAQKPMSPTARADMAQAFCDTVEQAGYTPGIYASQSWFNNMLTDERFDNWTKWVASYPSVGNIDAKSSYTSTHDMWQCMSRGVIDGIPGRVDIDFDYRFSEAHYKDVYNYEYYLAANPDVAAVFEGDRIGAFNHFMREGAYEGRDSSPTFNLHGYFNANPDLRREFGLNLKSYYTHYEECGQFEGRSMEDGIVPKGLVRGIHVMDLSAIYDPYVYLASNADLVSTYTLTSHDGKEYIDDSGLFKHFLNYGIHEGRVAK